MARHHTGDDRLPTAALALEAHLNVEGLKPLAALVAPRPPTRKAELVALLASHLEGERLRALWARLDRLGQAAIAEVVHGPGPRFQAERFRAKYGRDPDWGALDQYRRPTRPTPLCLFFVAGVMPDDLRERLRAFVPPPEKSPLASLDTLPAELTEDSEDGDDAAAVREMERAAQHDLVAVLRLVDAGKVPVSDKTRRPTASAVRAVAGVLQGGDFYADGDTPASGTRSGEVVGSIRAHAWPLLVQAAGLAQLRGSRLELGAAGRKALGAPAAEVLRGAWQRYLGTTLFDELGCIETIQGQGGKGKRSLVAVTERRRAIARALADCPVGRWVAVDELFRYMRAAGHDFEVTRSAWDLYVGGDPHYGSLGYEGFGGWNILQARYALAVLFEYAATMGMIDVAYVPPEDARQDYHDLWGTDELAFFSRYDGLRYIRLNALGAFCLGVAERYQPAPRAARPVLQVLPDLTVVPTGEALDAADQLALDEYAERSSDGAWRLVPGRLLGAIEAGHTVAEVRAFLETRSGAPLPHPAAKLLDDLAGRAGSLGDGGPARLIECAGAALATRIARDPRTRRLCLLAGERHLAVPYASEAAFRRALRELGYVLPAAPRRDA